MKNQLRRLIHFSVKSGPISTQTIILGIIQPTPILLIQFPMQFKSLKITQAFSKLRKKYLSFSFKFIDRKKIFNELQKLKSKKACQGSDISVKTTKENINIITDFIYSNFNNSMFSSYFSSNLKNADIKHVLKKGL